MAATAKDYEAIIYRVEDHIAYLTFNRPEALNAFSRQMVREIVAACQDINTDPDVRVVIVSGAGDRAFSAGLDLKEVAAGGGPGPIDSRGTRVRAGMHTHHGGTGERGEADDRRGPRLGSRRGIGASAGLRPARGVRRRAAGADGDSAGHHAGRRRHPAPVPRGWAGLCPAARPDGRADQRPRGPPHRP